MKPEQAELIPAPVTQGDVRTDKPLYTPKVLPASVEIAPPLPEERQQTALAVAKQPRTIKELIQGDEFKSAVAACLPRHLRPERFVRVALTALLRQPDLLSCSKESFFRAMLDLSAYGLEPDGRRAHLIPFGNSKTGGKDIQLIIDWKGLAELVRRSGEVSYLHADVVYPGDEFSYGYGSDSHLRHKPAMKRPDKAEPICFYSFVKLRNGDQDFVVMSKDEVDRIRKRSRAAQSGPWVTDYDEMGKKTVFRRHSKSLPLTAEVREAVERDDEDIDFSALNIAEEQAKVELPPPIDMAEIVPAQDQARPEKG